MNLLKKSFIFNQGKGLGNENVLATDGPDAVSEEGHVWCLSSIQLAVFAGYLGSPDSFAPADRKELGAFVIRMFEGLQEETDLIKEAEKAISTVQGRRIF